MKRMRDPKRTAVKALLARRGMTLTDLAAQAGVSRCHLSLALVGAPAPSWGVRGGSVRKKLVRHLTDEERQVLGW